MIKSSVKFFVLALLFALIASPFFIISQAAETGSFLEPGSRAPVFKLIQYILNLDSATRVATTGDGSLGQETEYFGPKTVLAVYRFQKKYGITGESGRIGLQTLKTMVHLAPSMIDAQRKNKPVVPVDWPEAEAKTTIRPAVKSYSSSLSKKSVTIKQKPPVVTVKAIKPKLSSLSPLSVYEGQVVTIRGEGFTKTGNDIVTKFKTINNISSSDGRTLLFKFSLPLGEEALSSLNSLPSGAVDSFAVPIPLYVKNSNGQSGELTFSYQLK